MVVCYLLFDVFRLLICCVCCDVCWLLFVVCSLLCVVCRLLFVGVLFVLCLVLRCLIDYARFSVVVCSVSFSFSFLFFSFFFFFPRVVHFVLCVILVGCVVSV